MILSSLASFFKRLLILAVVVLGIGVVTAAISTAGLAGYEHAYANRIFPGVSALGVSLDGLTQKEALSALKERAIELSRTKLQFRLNDQTFSLPVASREKQVDLLITYPVDALATRAFQVGREGNLFQRGLTQLRLRVRRLSLSSQPTVDTATIETQLRALLEPELKTVKNAELRVTLASASGTTIAIVPEQIGLSVDLGSAMRTVVQQAERFVFEPILLHPITIQPEWTTKDIQPLTDQVPSLLEHAPVRLFADGERWTFSSSTVAGWLNAVTSTRGLIIGIDAERLAISLAPLVADFLSDPKDGSLEMKEGKMVAFDQPVDGVGFDPLKTSQDLTISLSHGSSTANVSLPRRPGYILGPDAVAMGLNEMLGTGRSSFTGSPTNRRKNIALGAQKVNGTLVAPDQEFSLLTILGTIDGENGWFPELVIKGNKTTPEFGGGLCQIGTTMFRAAVHAGMLITERANHSYRVSYYEPAGTDATIYSPAPDFKFKNDTGKWILITTSVRASNLLFTVWGTRDGRMITVGEPKIYNITPPPAKKIIETLDLPAGETKCTETAHAGADAKFDYTVVSAKGETKKVTFFSHYKPWGAVCLVGVTQLSDPAQPSEKIDETGINNPR